MSSPGSVLTVSRAQAMDFRVTTGSGAPTNYLLQLDAGAGAGGASLTGLGEAQPRAGITGDSGSSSWEFLVLCLKELQGRGLDFSGRATALRTVRATMSEFALLGRSHAQSKSGSSVKARAKKLARKAAQAAGRVEILQPYRGVLFGIEVALLDLAAQAQNLSLSQLLTHQRDEVPVLPNQAVTSGDGFATILTAHGRSNPDAPLLISPEAKRGMENATTLVQELEALAAAERVTGPVYLYEPLLGRDRRSFDRLQQAAARTTDADIRVMAGTRTIRTPLSAGRVLRHRAGGGLDISPAAVGSVLSSIDIAESALAVNPDLTISVSPLPGSADVSLAALKHFAMSAPGVAFFVGDEEDTTATVSAPQGIGLGARIPYEQIVSTVRKREAFPPLEDPSTKTRQPNIYSEVTYLQPLGPNGTKGHLLERQALMLGLTTTRYSKGAFTVTDGVQDPLLMKWSRSPLSSAVALALCTHKEATRIRLGRAGVPVPRGRTFVNGDFDAAREFADRIGFPVVVKPAMGVRGIGVVANIGDRAELDEAFRQLGLSKLGDQDFIVEKHVSGADYRIVVVGDEVIAAILREPASVIGDGERTIAELMIIKNFRRRLNPHLWGRPIVYDEAAKYQLARVGASLETVPALGEQVMLSNSCSLSQGGDSIDVLDELHPTVKAAAVAAVKAIPGLGFCGVDFLLEDHTKPVTEQQAGICELNAHAAIGNCEYPMFGQPRQVAQTFMDECVKRYGLAVSAHRADQLQVKLTIRGRVVGVGYRAWMRKQAQTFGISGTVRNAGPRKVEAILVGGAEPVSALAAAAVLGPRRSVPTSVSTEHIENAPAVNGFTVELPKVRRFFRG